MMASKGNCLTEAPIRPFVIWTLQRTGGTNLTQRLVERSGIPSAPHEPFNVGRVYGEITKHWMESGDEAALIGSMKAIAAKRENIKHCVEMVPWEVTKALIDATVEAGYHHLFLYRANAKDRLLSLHFARSTGIWGPNMKGEEVPDDALSKELPVEQLVAHERMCSIRMNRAWRYLHDLGVRPYALSYEQVYRSEPHSAGEKLCYILKGLGLSRGGKSDRLFVEQVLGRGDQGTRDKYSGIPGVDMLEASLKGVVRFLPNSKQAMLVIQRMKLPSWVLRAQIDVRPDSLTEGEPFHLGGVVVLSNDAPYETSTLEVTAIDGGVKWGISSPKMGEMYPDSNQSSRARFKTTQLVLMAGCSFTLLLRDGKGNRYPLFKIEAKRADQ